MKYPLAVLCISVCAALFLAPPAAADNRPGWSDGPGCGEPGDGCAPGWTDPGKDGDKSPRIRARLRDPMGPEVPFRLRLRVRKSKDAGPGSGACPGWSCPGGWPGPGGFPGWSGPGGFPGWTDPKVCSMIDEEMACDAHPVCRWHPAHEVCVPG